MINKKYLLIGISACLLIFMVKMCESTKYQIDQTKVEEFKQMQNTGDSLLMEIVSSMDNKDSVYVNRLDSLNQLLSQKNISKTEKIRLEKEIVRTEISVEVDRVDDSVVSRNRVIYNIVSKDTVIYNIIEVDSIVPKIIYEIDTIHYDSDDVKKLKLRNI